MSKQTLIERPYNQDRNRKSFFICIIALIICFGMCVGIAEKVTSNEPMLGYDLLFFVAQDEGCKIYVESQQIDGKKHVFLPSCSDFSRMKIWTNEDCIISGETKDELLLRGDSENLVDLTGLFGDMRKGKSYTLSVFSQHSDISEQITIMCSDKIKSLFIMLDGQVAPNDVINYLHADKGNWLSGNIVELDEDGNVIASVQLKKIKGRGNTSWACSGEKRPYNIKLDEPQELIDGAGTAKEWCLISNNVLSGADRTGINNKVAYELYEKIDGTSPIASQFVDLYINHEYRGLYLLTEKVEIGKNRIEIEDTVNDNSDVKLIEIDKEDDDIAIELGVRKYQYSLENTAEQKIGGYLLEIDSEYLKEPSWFITRRGVQIVIKEPKYATRGQVQRIASHIQSFEDALYSETGYNDNGMHYSELMDMESWTKQFLVDTFLTNIDLFDKSSFLQVNIDEYGRLQKIVKGPVWDFDYCQIGGRLFCDKVGRVDSRREIGFNHNIWACQLLRKGDFVNKMYKINETIFKEVIQQIKNEKLVEMIDEIYIPLLLNEKLWGGDFNERLLKFIMLLSKRYTTWYDDIWSKDNLLGLNIEARNGLLYATIHGSYNSIQWYIINTETNTGVQIKGATDETYSPVEPGLYYVSVEGENIGFDKKAEQEIEKYIIEGTISSVAEPMITMNSNVVYWGE